MGNLSKFCNKHSTSEFLRFFQDKNKRVESHKYLKKSAFQDFKTNMSTGQF